MNSLGRVGRVKVVNTRKAVAQTCFHDGRGAPTTSPYLASERFRIGPLG